jgi:hypothetical protein
LGPLFRKATRLAKMGKIRKNNNISRSEEMDFFSPELETSPGTLEIFQKKYFKIFAEFFKLM